MGHSPPGCNSCADASRCFERQLTVIMRGSCCCRLCCACPRLSRSSHFPPSRPREVIDKNHRMPCFLTVINARAREGPRRTLRAHLAPRCRANHPPADGAALRPALSRGGRTLFPSTGENAPGTRYERQVPFRPEAPPGGSGAAGTVKATRKRCRFSVDFS